MAEALTSHVHIKAYILDLVSDCFWNDRRLRYSSQLASAYWTSVIEVRSLLTLVSSSLRLICCSYKHSVSGIGLRNTIDILVMRQLTLHEYRGLSTSPLNLNRTSTSDITTGEPPGSHSSPRSQVRALENKDSLNHVDQHPMGVRVECCTSAASEVASATNKEEPTPVPAIVFPTQAMVRLRKRSLLRALKRAAQEGVATYQRRQLRVWGQPSPPQTDCIRSKPHNQGPRLNIVTWNCGGLSQEVQLEVFAWMQLNPHIGAFVLQETHWGFSGDYVQGEWCVCHSSTAKGHTGGILIAVRKQLTDMRQIRWRELEPGRLVHWRGPIGKQKVDILAVYQHAMSYSTSEVKAELMRKRKSLWNKLDSCVASLPLRSSVFITGDFKHFACGPPPGFGFWFSSRFLPGRAWYMFLVHGCFLRS